MEEKINKISKNFKSTFGIEMPEQALYAQLLKKVNTLFDDYLYKAVGETEAYDMLKFLEDKIYNKPLQIIEDNMRSILEKEKLTPNINNDTLKTDNKKEVHHESRKDRRSKKAAK